MPTAAKIIGGLLLAITAGYSTYLFIGINPLFTVSAESLVINVLIGFVVGWRSIGFDAGYGGVDSVLAGIRGSILLILLTSAAFGIWVVYVKIRGFFIKDITTVFSSWVDASMNYMTVFTDPYVIFVIAVGGIISGIASGLANRFWS